MIIEQLPKPHDAQQPKTTGNKPPTKCLVRELFKLLTRRLTHWFGFGHFTTSV